MQVSSNARNISYTVRFVLVLVDVAESPHRKQTDEHPLLDSLLLLIASPDYNWSCSIFGCVICRVVDLHKTDMNFWFSHDA